VADVADKFSLPADFKRDRVHLYLSAFSVPTSQVWPLLILVSLLILPYGFFQAYYHDQVPREGEYRITYLKLMIVAGTYFAFWGVHLYALAIRPQSLRKWKWLEELARNPSFRLKPTRKGTMGAGWDPGLLGMILSGFTEQGLVLVFAVPFAMFLKNFELFVGIQCGICVLISLAGFLFYIRPQADEVQLSDLGVMVAMPHNVSLCPWESIEQVVWKEPRWDPLQMDLQFKPMGKEKGITREIKLEPISDEERDQILQFLSEHVSVKRLWGKGEAK